MKLYVKLLFLVGGWWVGGSEKNEINAILNSKLKLELVEVGVELGKMNDSKLYFENPTPKKQDINRLF